MAEGILHPNSLITVAILKRIVVTPRREGPEWTSLSSQVKCGPLTLHLNSEHSSIIEGTAGMLLSVLPASCFPQRAGVLLLVVLEALSIIWGPEETNNHLLSELFEFGCVHALCLTHESVILKKDG